MEDDGESLAKTKLSSSFSLDDEDDVSNLGGNLVKLSSSSFLASISAIASVANSRGNAVIMFVIVFIFIFVVVAVVVAVVVVVVVLEVTLSAFLWLARVSFRKEEKGSTDSASEPMIE